MRNKRSNPNLNGFSLAIAMVAWLLVFLWRDSCLLGNSWILYLQPLCSLGLAVGLYWFSSRCSKERDVDFRMVPFAVAAGVSPFLIGWIEREQGLGSPWEVLSMMVFANWTLLLATASRFERYQNLTAIFAGTATFVVVSMIEGWQFSLLGGIYGILVLWWSMTRYWQKLEQKFAQDQRSELSMRSLIFLSCFLCMAGLSAAILWFAPSGSLNLRGFSWFSGGEGRSDEFARDGVGLGDGIRAATQNPVTFGPVESDMFMESQQPTLYDITSDAYGPPHKVRRSNRAVGIEAQMKKNSGDRVARSQQATGDFSVARKPRSVTTSKASDQLANVLFYWKGSAPNWLALETYNHFEEGFWLQLDPDSAQKTGEQLQRQPAFRRVTLEEQWSRPWMKLRNQAASLCFGGWDYGAVKVINFRSLRIPTPPCLEQLYIDRINREDFFLVGSDDIPQLNHDGSYVPADTVVHLLSARVNLYQAQTRPENLASALKAKLPLLGDYLCHDFVADPVAELARAWTAGQQQPWEQVQTIVTQLRTQYKFDPDATLPEGTTDAAGYLIEHKSGTDYMFATIAAFMTRSLGIPSRVVKGFWVDPAKYDRKTGHTPVIGKDLHVWVEVSLDGVTWIPIEPTPGYPLPHYHLTWSQHLVLSMIHLKRSITRNLLSAIALLVLGGLLVWQRKRILDLYQTLVWWFFGRLSPQSIVLRSARLIDHRSRLAGLPRPASVTPARFSTDLARALGWDEENSVRRFAEALNRALYHPAPASQPTLTADSVLVSDCRKLISRFGLRALRRLKKNQTQLHSGNGLP